MSKNLKHGSVPTASIQDKATRDTAMRLNENIVDMARQLAELQRKVETLERKRKTP